MVAGFALTIWLDDQGIKTVQGGPWRTPTLAGLLSSPRNAGLRQHRRGVIVDAVWDPIISPNTRDRILARQLDRKVTGRRSPRRYLLTGLLRCGRCDNKLFSAARETTRRSVCLSGPDHGGCGRLTVVADPLEEFITRAVLYRLDSPDLAAALDGRTNPDAAVAGLADAIAEDQAQLEELAAVYAARDITMREWLAARKAIEARIADAQRRLARTTRTDALAGLPGHGAVLTASWSELNLTRQAAIVAAVMDRATIGPGTGAPPARPQDRTEASRRPTATNRRPPRPPHRPRCTTRSRVPHQPPQHALRTDRQTDSRRPRSECGGRVRYVLRVGVGDQLGRCRLGGSGGALGWCRKKKKEVGAEVH